MSLSSHKQRLGLAKLNASFEMMGGMGFDAIALQQYPEAQKINHVHHAETHRVLSMVLLSVTTRF